MMQEETLPRERLLQYGEQALSNEELLAIMLRTGTRGCPVLELAHLLLKQFGNSLLSLCNATVAELCQVPGIGEAKALELCASFALMRRIARAKAGIRPEMKNPCEVAAYMRDIIGESRQEEFHVLLLDSQLRLQRCERVSLGLLDFSLVHSREVFRPAIREACSSVILCHNHPSGDVLPSAEDKNLTLVLYSAGKIVGIKVLDHIIIPSNGNSASDAYYSFSEHKAMPDQLGKL